MNILGLSFGYHDAAASLLKDGRPFAAAEEERFSRVKHDADFPKHAAQFCLQQGGLAVSDLDAISYYEKPARKLERALQVGKHFSVSRHQPFDGKIISELRKYVDVEDVIRSRLGYAGPIFYCEHHQSHAASAFFISPFTDAAILTIDGVGEWASCVQFLANAHGIRAQREIRFPHSLGMFYSAITSYLGFAVNDDEYKIMGLASYGKPRFGEEFRRLITFNKDGSFQLQLNYFEYPWNTERMYGDALTRLLGPARLPHEPIDGRHADIAASLQEALESAILNMVRAIRDSTAASNLCLAGGVALNCVANARILAEGVFDSVFIPSAPGDSGAAMGAALWAQHEVFGQPHVPAEHSPLLGPEFSDDEILVILQKFGARLERFNEEDLCKTVASLISENFVIGWFQGRMEFGPRALGARSILANPAAPDMRDILNARVKFREEFRPFAPAVLEEAAQDYFHISSPSPFMLFTHKVRENWRHALPAITHVDGTARVQTVSRKRQPLFHRLITAVGEKTGVPMVVNTSFNVRGEPIVCSPTDALRCFQATDIDFLAIGSFLVSKV